MSLAQNATIVLVHGAWADGSCWRNVILPLQKEGSEGNVRANSPDVA